MLTECNLCSPTMVVPHWRYPESSNRLIHKAACLSSPDLVLKAWSFLGSYWSLVHIRNLKKPALLTVKEYSRNWTHGLASKCEGKQPKGKVSSFHVLSPGLQLNMETPIFRVSVSANSLWMHLHRHTQRYASLLPWVFLNLIVLIIKVSHQRRKPKVQTEAQVQQYGRVGIYSQCTEVGVSVKKITVRRHQTWREFCQIPFSRIFLQSRPRTDTAKERQG